MNKEVIVKYIATFFLVLMSIQYVLLEGDEVSYIKFGAMCLTPLIWLVYSPKFSKALAWGGLYFLAILFSALFNIESFRVSTVGYGLSFVFMFITYYNLIYFEKAFSLDYFIRLIKGLILAYAIVIILQQILHFVGIGNFPLLNTFFLYDRGWLSAPSLSIEPSHSARIVGALGLCLLKLHEIKWGANNVSISKIYNENKLILLAFLWTMLTMGSGTAFISLAILSLYFVKRKYLVWIIPLFVISYFVVTHIDYEPLQRAIKAIEVSTTLDAEKIGEADPSASVRILPFINTINNFDLTSSDFWFGEGIDTGVGRDKFGRARMIGGITDYGLLSYIFALLLIFECCIKKFFSIETLFFIVLLMAEIRSIYVWWAIFMMFATLKYFQIEYNEKAINK